MGIQGINHITLAVQDIQRAFSFYKDVVGLTPLCKWDRGAYFLAGDFWFCLNVDPNRIPTDCYTHYAFHVDLQDFDAASERVMNSGCTIFKENTSPGHSLYFLDPDGHKLELHSDTWQDRMAAKKSELGKWRDVEWFV